MHDYKFRYACIQVIFHMEILSWQYANANKLVHEGPICKCRSEGSLYRANRYFILSD